VLAKWREAVNQAVANPEVKAKLVAQGLEVPTLKPDEMLAFGRTELVKWSELVQRSGAHVD
jgi:tripartite-type tricarboxylate transporter receptor subunit TctC